MTVEDTLRKCLHRCYMRYNSYQNAEQKDECYSWFYEMLNKFHSKEIYKAFEYYMVRKENNKFPDPYDIKGIIENNSTSTIKEDDSGGISKRYLDKKYCYAKYIVTENNPNKNITNNVLAGHIPSTSLLDAYFTIVRYLTHEELNDLNNERLRNNQQILYRFKYNEDLGTWYNTSMKEYYQIDKVDTNNYEQLIKSSIVNLREGSDYEDVSF